jgi:Putative transmembrane protein (PGPGW)
MTTTAAPSTSKASPVRRIARVVGGWTLLGVGAALLVLPGPGLLVIAAGLALLATEYEWAARLLHKVKARLATARQAIGKKRDAARGENG